MLLVQQVVGVASAKQLVEVELMRWKGVAVQSRHTSGSFAWRVRMKRATAWRQVGNAAAAAVVRKTYC